MKSLAIILGFLTMGFVASAAIADDGPVDEQQNLFDTLDADGNGSLSSSEIPEERARYFHRLLRVGDKDEDGELTREEFRGALRERETPAAQPRGGQPRRGGGAFQTDRLFEQFDANKDDKLTLEELPEGLRRRMEPLFQDREEITREQLNAVRNRAFGPGQAAGMLQRLDADGDGKVKFSEVPEFLRGRLQPVFERLGSKELDVERIAEALAQQGDRGRPGSENRPPAGRGPVVLRVLDSDRDGRISREELATAGEKFDELDRNSDGQIDAPELFGFPPDGARPEGRRPGQRSQRPERETNRPRRPERESSDSRRERPRIERREGESRSRDSRREQPGS